MKQTGVGDIAEIMDLKIQRSNIYHFLMVIIFQAQRCLKFLKNLMRHHQYILFQNQ